MRIRRGARSWRWLRLVIPFAVALAVLVVTGVTHASQSPSAADPDFLNPESSAPIGARTLADRLRAEGVTIERVTGSPAALTRAYRGQTTLFIPAPAMMHPYYLRMLKLLPSSTRVVLVAPSGLTLDNGHLPARSTATRWATATAEPDCPLPEAVSAGRAAIAGTHYRAAPNAQTVDCYSNALLGVRVGAADVLLAGASDPFRNDRIHEYHNAALATGLLGTHSSVVWLDLHHPEQPPQVVHGGGGPVAPPFLGDSGSPDPDFPVQMPPPSQEGGGAQAGGAGGPTSTSLWSTFPPWLWLVLALLALIGVLLALAHGRRLGPPVSEPLPVVVPAAETVAGRGWLYRRAKARGPALHALRGAALRRLLPAYALPPEAPASDVLAAVAAGTGRDPAEVESILYGAEPRNDEELVSAVNELDALVHQALADVTVRPATPPPDAGPVDFQGETR